LEEQAETANQIDLLQVQVKDMGTKVTEVTNESQETLKAATDAYMQALTIYQQVFNLQVPKVETSNLDNEASEVTKEAKRIKDEAQRLIKVNDEVLQMTMNKRQELDDLLNSALLQQQQLDSKMADMEVHRKNALKAVELGNSVLEEAQGTLETLKDFENRVNENKDAANEALLKIANIEKTIGDANDKTHKAAEALRNTDKDSALAYEIAKESKNTAEGASINATSIVKESAKIKESAKQLNTDAKSLKVKSNETKHIIEEKNHNFERDKKLAGIALTEANKAQKTSDNATAKVEQAKKELEEIAQTLATIKKQDPSFLDELEQRLDAAEKKYNEADLEAKLKELEEAKQRQLRRKTDLKKEYDSVKEEVDTIKDILTQLPDFCPNNVEHALET